MNKCELVLIRGLPGSGKSTLARSMKTHCHIETDMFFTGLDGSYNYEKCKIIDAHEWFQKNTLESLLKGNSVVVSNTFTRIFEMSPYFEMAHKLGIEIIIITATGNFENVHSVPRNIIENMRKRWENISNEVELKK